MDLKNIVEQCKALPFCEIRTAGSNFSELVFYKKDLYEWDQFLSKILGPVAKPAGMKPSKEILELTQSYGGIRDNQIFYAASLNPPTTIAMLWPWGNGEHITLKLANI